MATKAGVNKARSVRRIPEEDRWSEDCVNWVKHVPWHLYKGHPEADGEIPEEKIVGVECFFLAEFSRQFFLRVSYTCSSNYSVYDGWCTNTHLLHAHFSVAQFVTHTHGSSVCKRVFAYVSFLSISRSPFS